ncbi:HPF/RaiA family ribosome-associated protein, partial [Thermus scotoductus]
MMKAWPWDKERTRNGASYLGYEVEEREIPYGIQLVVHDKGSGKACNVNFYNSGKRLPQGDPALLKKLEEELVKLDQQAKITIDLLPYGVTILNSEPTSADLIAAIRECFTRLERLSREKSGVDIKEKPGAQVLETVAQKENLCIENVAPEVTNPHSAPPSLQQVISPGPQKAHRGLVMGSQVEDEQLAPQLHQA